MTLNDWITLSANEVKSGHPNATNSDKKRKRRERKLTNVGEVGKISPLSGGEWDNNSGGRNHEHEEKHPNEISLGIVENCLKANAGDIWGNAARMFKNEK